jgi:hypothetical protein
MKGFISKVFMVLVFLGFGSQQVSAFTINNSVIQNAANLSGLLNQVGYTASHAREVCTQGINAQNPDSLCQAVITNCQFNYWNNSLNAPYNCNEEDSNGRTTQGANATFNFPSQDSFFKCEQDPTKPFNGVQSVDDETRGQFINALKADCGLDFSGIIGNGVQFQPIPGRFSGLIPSGNNAGTPTTDPAASPVTAPTNTDTSSNADVANATPAAPMNAGTASGCSLSPLQGSAPMTGTGILSTLMMIPFALRMKKKK